jgi:hypothetical protein
MHSEMKRVNEAIPHLFAPRVTKANVKPRQGT